MKMWQDQGRQYHMWFGHGTATNPENKLPDTGPNSIFLPGNFNHRIDAVAHGTFGHMPRKDWHRPILSFDRQRLERLHTAMTAWIEARTLSDASFEKKLIAPLIGDTVITALRAAAEQTYTARSHDDLKNASGHLAEGMQAVGLDKWPSFLRDAAERAVAYQSGKELVVPVQDSASYQHVQEQIHGGASYYNLPGNKMANGQLFDGTAMNAAMRHVPLGTKVRVVSADDPARWVDVTVTDRGPYAVGRIIDLTPAAFRALFGTTDRGVAPVTVLIPYPQVTR